MILLPLPFPSSPPFFFFASHLPYATHPSRVLTFFPPIPSDIPAFDWPVAPFPQLKYPLEKFEQENEAEELECLKVYEAIIKEWKGKSPVAAVRMNNKRNKKKITGDTRELGQTREEYFVMGSG